jgi:hypothetical protein
MTRIAIARSYPGFTVGLGENGKAPNQKPLEGSWFRAVVIRFVLARPESD